MSTVIKENRVDTSRITELSRTKLIKMNSLKRSEEELFESFKTYIPLPSHTHPTIHNKKNKKI
jgi:hypothetical protein